MICGRGINSDTALDLFGSEPVTLVKLGKANRPFFDTEEAIKLLLMLHHNAAVEESNRAPHLMCTAS